MRTVIFGKRVRIVFNTFSQLRNDQARDYSKAAILVAEARQLSDR